MNQTKLLSSNPDRLDLLMESEQFSEVLSPVVQPQAIIDEKRIDGRWLIIIKNLCPFCTDPFFIRAVLRYCFKLISNHISRNMVYIYATSFSFA